MAFRPVLAARGQVQMLTGDGESRWFGPIGRSLGGLVRSPFVRQRFTVFSATANEPDLRRLTEQAHTRGKVVVEMS